MINSGLPIKNGTGRNLTFPTVAQNNKASSSYDGYVDILFCVRMAFKFVSDLGEVVDHAYQLPERKGLTLQQL